MNEKKTKVLVAPLDWGLGHATRCIPIISHLTTLGAEVIIAAGGRPLHLLRAEFPELQFIDLPGYNVRYPRDGSMTIAMARQFPGIAWHVWKEHRWLNRWVESARPDLIVADNRFGLFHRTIPSIYITHQLRIKTPESIRFLQPALARLHCWIIEQYAECWIPDFETPPGIGGDLSHVSKMPRNARYVGPISRFGSAPSGAWQIDLLEENLDLVAILSGPEPQRSLFEELLLDQLQKTKLRAVVVEGRTEETTDEWITDRIRLVSRMTFKELKIEVERASVILARPGYCTVMDILALAKPAIFVPTPGQTEQEYLGRQLARNWGVVVQQQSSFQLDKAWEEIQHAKLVYNANQESLSYEPLLERLLSPIA